MNRNDNKLKDQSIESYRDINSECNDKQVYLKLCHIDQMCTSNLIMLMSGMIIVLVCLSVILIILIILQREKYPIQERSYLLSVIMCICFMWLMVSCPTAYLLNNYQIIIPAWYKFFYMLAWFGLYLSYFMRIVRIHIAFNSSIFDCSTDRSQDGSNIACEEEQSNPKQIRKGDAILRANEENQIFSGSNEIPSYSGGEKNRRFMNSYSSTQKEKDIFWINQLVIWLSSREWILAGLVVVTASLLSLPAVWGIFSSQIYRLPYEMDGGAEGNKDHLVSLIGFQIIVAFSILLIYLVRKVPLHYGFLQEAKLNLGTQWLKSIIVFVLAFIGEDDRNCSYLTAVSIGINYIQYFLMIGVCFLPALFRSFYKAPLPTFPDFNKFQDFIDQPDDQNFYFCNFSFLGFINELDAKTKAVQGLVEYRGNQNVYEFFFAMKNALLNSPKEKLQEILQIVDSQIINPKKDTLKLELSPNTFNSISNLTLLILNELANPSATDNGLDNVSSVNQGLSPNQNQLIQIMEDVLENKERYLRETIYQQAYTNTNAFTFIKDYFKEQGEFEANLLSLKLFHKRD